jgi:hypothetical protein
MTMAVAAPPVTILEIRERLRAFDFSSLFNDLGWDHLRANLFIDVDGTIYTLRGIAHKRGFQVFHCQPGPDGAIPDRAIRRRIDREVSKQAQEHLLIFTDESQTAQIWQWVRREPGKPLQHHEHELRRGQSGEALAQRLQRLYFSIADEDALTIPDVVGRVRVGFDAERITRQFYDRFKQEHDAFRGFISGISTVADRDWYASLMLNRLMFVYFIQKKGFFDGDPDYLRHKLAEVRRNRGDNQFHTFYRHFLLRLFHQGLSQQEVERTRELDALLGQVPYLNGGLFDVHALENTYADIDVPDEAFEALFDFFDAYRWHLDERPLRQDDEINPDVLGYIFEKYINQKQMGAYYTKEDITGYIARNTIIPAIFDKARPEARIAFEPNSTLWRLLQENPDRYLYPAMRKGMDLTLPSKVAVGLNDVTQRGEWNRPADEAFALPTETWREHIARRQRHDEVWQKIVDGGVSGIDDLITFNLDIHQFAVDAITECEGPETLRAFWRAIQRISVLDPTCGSGAFLFAALNILQPLADACLERMQAFVDELDRSDERPHPERYRDFRKTLAEVSHHHNREYFVLKQIILNNLYGVDIMEEAVEICKLRLFLKLVAQVETAEQIEPLPDIDFNIRAGNTLVGFATLDEVERSLATTRIAQNVGQLRIVEPDASNELETMREEAEKAALAFSRFRDLQEAGDDPRSQRAAKRDVRERLTDLRFELDQLLARVYGINSDGPEYFAWRSNHEPFHWVAEFYEVIQGAGGFDVVVGNPPFVEYSSARSPYSVTDFRTIECGNLYAFVTERSLRILGRFGRLGLVVPISLVAAQRMQTLQELLLSNRSVHIANFALRPAALFQGVMQRISLLIAANSKPERLFTTEYITWYAAERPTLFERIRLLEMSDSRIAYSIPKVMDPVGKSALMRIQGHGRHWTSYR